jgi:hypothetical protein
MSVNYIRFGVFATTMLAIAAAMLTGFRVSPQSIIKIIMIASMMLGLAWFYSRFRPRPKIARLLEGIAMLIVFSASGAVLSYAGIGGGMPL